MQRVAGSNPVESTMYKELLERLIELARGTSIEVEYVIEQVDKEQQSDFTITFFRSGTPIFISRFVSSSPMDHEDMYKYAILSLAVEGLHSSIKRVEEKTEYGDQTPGEI